MLLNLLFILAIICIAKSADLATSLLTKSRSFKLMTVCAPAIIKFPDNFSLE